MRDYGKVFTTFWSSSTIRGMSEDGRALALYLMTCPHGTIAGVFRLPDGYACEDLQWSAERVSKGFRELFEMGFANRCGTTKWVCINKFFEWNQPENPNQRKAIAKVIAGVPSDCMWLPDFHRGNGRHWGAEVAEKVNPIGTLSKPFLNQEQEQEQEQEQYCLRAAGSLTDACLATSVAPPQAATPPAKPPAIGTRLSGDWVLPNPWREWAEAERSDLDIVAVADSFRDFWISKPGKDGRKSDWQATWRNWVRAQKATPFNQRHAANASTPDWMRGAI